MDFPERSWASIRTLLSDFSLHQETERVNGESYERQSGALNMDFPERLWASIRTLLSDFSLHKETAGNDDIAANLLW